MFMVSRFIKTFSKSLLLASMVIFIGNSFMGQVNAAACNFDKKVVGIPVWYKYLSSDESRPNECRLQIDDPSDALPIGLAVFEAALTIAGFLAVIMIFVGGFKYVLAQGEADRAAAGRKTVINALIGLVIVIVSTRVITFIGNTLG